VFGSYASAPVRNCRAPIPKTLPRICLTSQPLTVECRRGHLAGSVRVNTLTHHELSAFEQNTGYTTRGCEGRRGHGRGRRRERGRARGGSSQTPSGGSSTQIGSSQASQATVQSNQLTQEQVRSSIGSEYGGGS
jgi:hypothetical protein